MRHKNEVVLTSVEQLNVFLRKNCNDKTIISVVMEPVSKNVIGEETDG
jgi:hypothetical protein